MKREPVKGRRPVCPDCGMSNPNSRGTYWTCKGCGRSWLKNYRGRFRLNITRPDCPNCKAPGDKVWANGEKWLCTVCKKSWVKKTWPRRKDLGLRPPCPECGAPEPESLGPRWGCTRCGRCWTKEYRLPGQYTILDLLSVPVVSI